MALEQKACTCDVVVCRARSCDVVDCRARSCHVVVCSVMWSSVGPARVMWSSVGRGRVLWSSVGPGRVLWSSVGPARVMPVSNESLSRTRHESQLIDDAASDAAERLIMTEKLIRELNETWEEKIRKSEEIRRQR